MPLDRPTERRWKPVRLIDLPLEKRVIAAHIAIRDAADERERAEIMAAALAPSSQTYWVAA